MKKLAELISNLEQHRIKGAFRLRPTDVLSQVCDIPKAHNYSGVYLFYRNNKELIYVGISGKDNKNGGIIHRQDGLRGRFLNGKQFGVRRSISLANQMKIEGISELNIHWFVTYGEEETVIPRLIEREIIRVHKLENGGKRPIWNKRD